MLRRGHTPIETYLLSGRRIAVKRDDLVARPPAPRLAKVRGFHLLLERFFNEGIRLIGAFEAGASSAGHAVAATVRNFSEMKCIIGYVNELNEPRRNSIQSAKRLGAEVLPLRPNVLNVCYGQTKKYVESKGGRMIPFGFEFDEAVDSVATEARSVALELTSNGTLVVCCGSGVTLAGIYRGLKGRPRRFIGVSSGRSIPKIRACLKRQGVDDPTIELIEPCLPYRTACENHCPFPSDKYYDRKAWNYLKENIRSCEEPILFWNVGS